MKTFKATTRSASMHLMLLALIVLMLGGTTRVKAEDNEALSALHQFRVQNFIALNAYYNYSANSDKSILPEISDAEKQANELMGQVKSSAASIVGEDQLKALQGSFDQFRKLMKTNIKDVKTSGYPDLRLVSDMAASAQKLNQLSEEMYNNIKIAEGIKSNPNVETARKATALMALMMTKYAARSTSNVSQVFQGADNEKPLDEQAIEMDQLIDQLRKVASPQPTLNPILSDVYSKWLFIRKSYINYNENNVAFLINRYSQGIIRRLTEATAVLNN